MVTVEVLKWLYRNSFTGMLCLNCAAFLFFLDEFFAVASSFDPVSHSEESPTKKESLAVVAKSNSDEMVNDFGASEDSKNFDYSCNDFNCLGSKIIEVD